MKGAKNIWIKTFNKVYEEDQDEQQAMDLAWSKVNDKYFQDSNGKWKKRK